MKLKLKSRKGKKWLKQPGAKKRIANFIQKDIDDGEYDSRDWLQLMLEGRHVEKGLIAWLFDQEDPIDETIEALRTRYLNTHMLDTAETARSNG